MYVSFGFRKPQIHDWKTLNYRIWQHIVTIWDLYIAIVMTMTDSSSKNVTNSTVCCTKSFEVCNKPSNCKFYASFNVTLKFIWYDKTCRTQIKVNVKYNIFIYT